MYYRVTETFLSHPLLTFNDCTLEIFQNHMEISFRGCKYSSVPMSSIDLWLKEIFVTDISVVLNFFRKHENILKFPFLRLFLFAY